MSTLDKEKQLELEPLTLEDLELDVSEPSINFTATLHFEFSDIFNAIEHIETELEESATDEMSKQSEEQEVSETVNPAEPQDESEMSEQQEEIAEPEAEPESEPFEQPEIESESGEPAADEVTEEAPEIDEVPADTEEESEPETPVHADTEEDAIVPVPAEPAPAKPKSSLIARLRGQDKGTKKLVITDIILLAVIVISIVAGLAVANSLVDKANAANEQKIAEMQANIKEVKLSENLYNLAADQVIEDVAVPTYTLDELYALDLREKTGFTAEDLKIITRKGLVGCEAAFVKAEETYGVNSIFLISIASLESAYGTQMFRPNNMFGYGRTGFSSKEECIMTVAKGLGTRYLPPGGSLYGGSPTLKGVNKRYAANPQWYYKVGKYMQGYYAELAAAKNGALDKFE